MRGSHHVRRGVFIDLCAAHCEKAGRYHQPLLGQKLWYARGQRLSAFDGLAAAAAHELGTPLATIALVAKELKRELPDKGPHTEDIDLLISQTGRCREILSRLANRDTQTDDMYARVKLLVMIEDLVAPIRGPDVIIDITIAGDGIAAHTPEPVFRRNPAIAYGLGNLLENAVDFAERRSVSLPSGQPRKCHFSFPMTGPALIRPFLTVLVIPS